MSCRRYHHQCLVFIIFTFPYAEDKFPKVCTSLTSLKNKKCYPIPKGFTAPCGNDGNRGTCQELIIHDCSFKYSHYQTFQKGDEHHSWPHALYHKTCKCNSNFAGYDCSKCEFGYYGKNFLKLSAEKKDQYMRCINMSSYYISNYVVTLTPYQEINKTVMANRDPTALCHNISNYDLFAWIHYYAARGTIFPHNMTRGDIDFANLRAGVAYVASIV